MIEESINKESIFKVWKDFQKEMTFIQKAKQTIISLFKKRLEEEKIQELRRELLRDKNN
jgi:hypothetical protein